MQSTKAMEAQDAIRMHWSLLRGAAVVDAAGHALGRLREISVHPGPRSDRVSELIWGPKGKLLAAAPSDLEQLGGNGVLRLKTDAHPRPFSMSEAVLLLDRDLLDQQIVDVYGRKVVRVNDVALLWPPDGNGAAMRLLEVEVGTRGAMRRLMKGLGSHALIERVASHLPSKVIPWEFVDLIEVDPARRVRLNISQDRIGQLHPSDIADILEDLAPAQREAVFNMLDEEVAADALEEADPRLQKLIVEAIGSERAADIVEEMDPSAAADLLAELSDARSEAILEEMEPAEREEVEGLLEFREDSAAGRMTTQYIAVSPAATVGDAIETLRHFDEDPEAITEIYLVDDDGILRGVVPLAKLVLAEVGTSLATLAETGFVTCSIKLRDRQVAELFDRYNLHALPIVDEQNKLVGVVQADHVIAFLREKS